MNSARRFKAVLFDVDGTLYRQQWLRAAMAGELAASPLTMLSWRRGVTAARVVKSYRQAHEELRQLGAQERPLTAWQIERTAREAGVETDVVTAVVSEWMLQRPLKYLRWCRRRGLLRVLEALSREGVRLGVLSDYPPASKLEALGASRYFSLVLCTTATDVNALKPHPRGFLAACESWGLRPQDVLYVGDRPDVDGEGATAAGLACAIIGGRGSVPANRKWFRIRHFDELYDVL